MLERMIKMFRNVYTFRQSKVKEGEHDNGNLKQMWNKIINLKDLTDLFDKYSELLSKIEERDLNQRIKNLASVWFSLYEDEFRSLDKKIPPNELNNI